MTSSNSLLHELVQQKRKSTSSEVTDSLAKTKKRDQHDSGHSIAIASEKEGRKEGRKYTIVLQMKHSIDSASDEAHPTLQDDDALSLFGDYSLVDEPLEPEEDLSNDELLSQITTSLSSSYESGPLVSDKLSKLVNDKFHSE